MVRVKACNGKLARVPEFDDDQAGVAIAAGLVQKRFHALLFPRPGRTPTVHITLVKCGQTAPAPAAPDEQFDDEVSSRFPAGG